MATKRKAAKKSAKKSAKKPASKSVKKMVKKAARKPKAKKKAVKKTRRKAADGGMSVQVAPVLEQRLRALAVLMQKPLNQLMDQALSEFADNWEEHMRTLHTLGDDSDRMQIVAPTAGLPKED
jgi:predicted HicB family RNase H-like nuclease